MRSNSRYTRLFTLVLAAAVALLFTACDSGGDDDDGGGGIAPDVGSSSVNVTGGDGTNFSGSGVFATSADLDPESGEGTSIVLFRVSEGDTLVVAIGREADGVPAEGTYAFFDGTNAEPSPDEFIAIFYRGTANTTFLAVSEGGSLTIDASSDSRVEGTFAFTGQGFNFRDFTQEPVSVTADGSFTAARATSETIQELDDIFDDSGL